ncbi:unnamed protein product [Durusdinium trenchii]|uniref:Uncharacterized protein n=1 Tax=Durusdinium trenchii TaxID=1381693 RepID=A0ABP0PMI4_9DINO
MSSTETEKSEPEKPIKVCGRARGKGCGRGRACKRPVSASASSRPATQAKVQDDGSDVSTSSSSQSEESRRIAAAAASWEDHAAGKRKESDSEDGGPTSNTSLNLINFMRAAVKGLQVDQVELVRRTFSETEVALGEFCAGMATGSICAAAISRVLEEEHGLSVRFRAAFYTECVPWKQKIIQRVHEAVDGQTMFNIISRTGDLVSMSRQMTCDIAVKAIECDDISTLSRTPRGVLDVTGKSGSSFVEFLQWLSSVQWSSRPRFIVIECVAALAKLRKVVQERGTAVVQTELAERGYCGIFKAHVLFEFD